MRKITLIASLLLFLISLESHAGWGQAFCAKSVYENKVTGGIGPIQLTAQWEYKHTEVFCGGWALYCAVEGVQVIVYPQ